MNLRECLHRVTVLPPHEVPYRTARFFWRKLKRISKYYVDKNSSTYVKKHRVPPGKLLSYLKPVTVELLKVYRSEIAGVTGHYLAHRFDLLGSGWVQVKYGMECRGLEGFRYKTECPNQVDCGGQWLKGRVNTGNLAESKRIWSLLDRDYVPIDWQVDFKSGFRWDQTVWYRKIRYAPLPGSDIKVPWELARMQHLPQLAWAYALAKDGDEAFQRPEAYLREFRNQVLDFIATNPPRFGPNWECTMEVGIRVSNLLVGYDLFRGYGARFDTEFEQVFLRSVYEHGLHIINNLEWFADLRANHYLADVVGLLFAAAYLPSTPETDAWLAFAVQELVKEVESQFHPDGSNFEASTSYHRLSAEMVVYATALVMGLPGDKLEALKNYDHKKIMVQPGVRPGPAAFYPLGGIGKLTPFPGWYIERLEKMAEFTMHITKPNGSVVQVGDNDSGRFLKLHPSYRKMSVAEARALYANLEDYADLADDEVYWDEDILDHRHLVAAINGLFERDDFTGFSSADVYDFHIIKGLTQDNHFSSYLKPGESTAAEQYRGNPGKNEEMLAVLDSIPESQRHVEELSLPGDSLIEGLKVFAYPDFGLYIFRSGRLYLAARCGTIGQNGYGGHAHNDHLSIELNVDGKDVVADPGTYIYTPLPEIRNKYRSLRSHSAPQLKGMEFGRLDIRLFQLGDQVKIKGIGLGRDWFAGEISVHGFKIFRHVLIKENSIRITDSCIPPGSENHQKEFLAPPNLQGKPNVSRSPGYGKRFRVV